MPGIGQHHGNHWGQLLYNHMVIIGESCDDNGISVYLYLKTSGWWKNSGILLVGRKKSWSLLTIVRSLFVTPFIPVIVENGRNHGVPIHLSTQSLECGASTLFHPRFGLAQWNNHQQTSPKTWLVSLNGAPAVPRNYLYHHAFQRTCPVNPTKCSYPTHLKSQTTSISMYKKNVPLYMYVYTYNIYI